MPLVAVRDRIHRQGHLAAQVWVATSIIPAAKAALGLQANTAAAVVEARPRNWEMAAMVEIPPLQAVPQAAAVVAAVSPGTKAQMLVLRRWWAVAAVVRRVAHSAQLEGLTL